MQITKSLVTGLAGAVALTLAHAIARQMDPRSARLDRFGMEAVARSLRAAGVRPPRGKKLRTVALVADLVTNTLQFASLGSGKPKSLLRGALRGVTSGLGVVKATKHLGLTPWGRGSRRRSQLVTIGLHALAGLAAAGVGQLLLTPAPADAD